MKRIPQAALLLAASIACSTRLTDAAAEQAVLSNPLIDQRTDAVKIEAISQESGSMEAIVKATIAGTRMNLKLRRFDKGWSWEAVEARAEGWVAIDVAMTQLRETQRQQRAAEWASEHFPQYVDSVEAISVYLDSLPSSTILGIREGWFKVRELFVQGAKVGNWTEAQRRERIKMFSEPAIDAWGQEVLMAFEDANRTATFVSVGPDKTKGTRDDIVCIAAGQRVWSPADEHFVWEYRKTWRVPEYLDKAVAPHVEKGDNVEFVKVQK